MSQANGTRVRINRKAKIELWPEPVEGKCDPMVVEALIMDLGDGNHDILLGLDYLYPMEARIDVAGGRMTYKFEGRTSTAKLRDTKWNAESIQVNIQLGVNRRTAPASAGVNSS